MKSTRRSFLKLTALASAATLLESAAAKAAFYNTGAFWRGTNSGTSTVDVGDTISYSLLLNSASSQYLSRTQATNGNQKTWTFSTWVKPSRFGSQQPIFCSGTGTTNYALLTFSANAFYNASDTLKLIVVVANNAQIQMETTAVFRDPSAWYHIVVAVDTTQATDTNRVKIYINGAQVTSFITATYPPTQNMDIGFYNTTTPQQIGTLLNGSYGYFDGYISQVHFIDGQALTPTSFGRVSTQTGVWVSKNYAGTYGTNGYKLDFSNANMLGGDNQSSSGDPYWNNVVLSLNMNGTNGSTTFTDSKSGLVPTVYGNTQISSSTSPFAGGSSGYFDGSGDYLSYASSSTWDLSGDFCIECWVKSDVAFTSLRYIFNRANGAADANAYCLFVNNSTPGRVTFAMNANEGGQYALESTTNLVAGTWYHIAVTRSGSTMRLFINGSQEDTFTSTTNLNVAVPFIIGGNYNWQGNIDDFRITKGAARYTYNFTPPTSENPSTGGGGFGLYGGIGSENQVIDTPTNNFAVWTSTIRLGADNTAFDYMTVSSGGLTLKNLSNAVRFSCGSFLIPTTGKWYWEFNFTVDPASGTNGRIGIASTTCQQLVNGTGTRYYTVQGTKESNGSSFTYDSGWANKVGYIGIAVDSDANTIRFYRDGNDKGIAFSDLAGAQWFPAFWIDNTANNYTFYSNFGQGGQTGLTYNSASGGRFKYTPPTGFKALCSSNLPDPVIKKPSQYFDVIPYSGSGGSGSQTILEFQPDFVWVKGRNAATSHRLTDSSRGGGKSLFTDSTVGESTNDVNGYISGFLTNGFLLAMGTTNEVGVNALGTNYISSSWKKGTTPGFDIVTYTGTLSSAGNMTVSHSLGVKPAMYISKSRNTNGADVGMWFVWHQSLASNKFLRMNTNDGVVDTISTGGGTLNQPTTTQFFPTYNSGAGVTGNNYVAYIFAEVSGFSKFGSYTGNGIADGPFVWCGFRPRWVMFKRSDSTIATGNWVIIDSRRQAHNVMGPYILADSSAIESTYAPFDFLANGFKIRIDGGTGPGTNASGGTYIFAAFAEAPFKYARAR